MPQVTPHELTREYEDYLDWLENHRRDRTKRNGGHRVFFGVTSLFANVFAFAGAALRRR